MAVSKIKVSFESNVQKVWEIVTSLKNYGWRSDLSRIEIQTSYWKTLKVERRSLF